MKSPTVSIYTHQNYSFIYVSTNNDTEALSIKVCTYPKLIFDVGILTQNYLIHESMLLPLHHAAHIAYCGANKNNYVNKNYQIIYSSILKWIKNEFSGLPLLPNA